MTGGGSRAFGLFLHCAGEVRSLRKRALASTVRWPNAVIAAEANCERTFPAESAPWKPTQQYDCAERLETVGWP